MGTCGTKLTKEQKNQHRISKQIDKDAADQFKAVDETIKILLLGPGESGKSTLLKQMNTIYSDGYNDEEMRSYIHIIRNNLLDSVKTLIEQCGLLKEKGVEGTVISPENTPISEEIMNVYSLEENDAEWVNVCDKVAKLWEEENGMHITYEHRSMYQMPGAGDFFIKKSKAIGSSSFFPKEEDILRARIRTTGIVEKEFFIGKTKFKIFDVGGQRNERKKWIHCFEDVTCVIFVVSLAGYDQFLYEDDSVPRMKEALDLFEEISNNRYFKNTSIVLFLNKSDLFKAKIVKTPLTVLFEDYKGHPTDFDENTNFIKQKFLDLNNSKSKEVYSHITCATNNDNIKHVMAAVTDVFIKEKLAKGGLLY